METSCVGWWVVVTDDGEFLKWGKDGGVEEPHQQEKEAAKQAENLAKEYDCVYLLQVFSNGCLKTWNVT